MLPLQGIRVIDWSIWIGGPIAGVMLSDLGAEVIKIEDRVTGDPGRGIMRVLGAMQNLKGRNFYFENNNRNKMSITLDLKKEKAREVVYKLVEKSDVFIHNFRKDVPGKLGLDYKTLSKYNPKLVYGIGSGYGPEGPEANDPSFDYQGQARSGFMFVPLGPDKPPVWLPGGIADQMQGTMLAYGVLAALVARDRTGVGQEVDASHLGSMIWLLGVNVASSLMVGKEFPAHDRAAAGNPLWNHYQCSDGKWICLALLQSDRYWHDFCTIMGIAHLEHDPKFENMERRGENCRELISTLDRIFLTKTRDEWMRLFQQCPDFVYTSVNHITELAHDRQALANGYITDFDHPVLGPIKIVGSPIKLSKMPVGPQREAPEFGQHTEQVLLDICGYNWDDIAQFKEQEVI